MCSSDLGEIKIIGYFETETILQAIDKNIIQATLAVDTVKLGKLSIESMYEYITTSRVSDYRAVDITIIDQTNIEEFLLQSEEGDK